MSGTSDLARMLDSLPSANEPFYSQDRTNSPILLGRSDVLVSSEAGTKTVRAQFRFDWFPRVGVTAEMSSPLDAISVDAAMGDASSTVTPRLPQDLVPRPPARSGTRRRGHHAYWSETFIRLDVGNDQAELARGVLHLINWPSLHGTAVRVDGGFSMGRVVLEGGGWTVVIDQRPDASDAEKEALRTRGYAMTHVASVTRTDQEQFKTSQLAELDEAMAYLGSFAHGFRCGPVLPVGFDTSNRAVWSQWSSGWVQGMVGAWSWLDDLHPQQLVEFFPLFIARWTDAYWREVLRLAITYYLQTNSGTTIELGIALAHVVLESLAYSWLVVERKLWTKRQFKGAAALDAISAMLTDMGIPIAVPAVLAELVASAPRGTATQTGPKALVRIRNEVFHVRPRPKGAAPNYGPRIDAWRLAIWYVEMAILRVCGYSGVHRNRVRGEAWVGTVDPVPWAPPPQTPS